MKWAFSYTAYWLMYFSKSIFEKKLRYEHQIIKELRCFELQTLLLEIFFLFGNIIMYRMGVRELNFDIESIFIAESSVVCYWPNYLIIVLVFSSIKWQ